MAYIFVLECRIKKKEFCKLYLRTMKSAAQYNFKYTNVLEKLKEKNEIYCNKIKNNLSLNLFFRMPFYKINR